MIDHEDEQVVTVPRWAMLECAGDARDAMVYAQITWWFQPAQRDGSPRTKHRVERDGMEWMYLTDDDMAEELGMSRGQVQRARASLAKRALIDTLTAKVGGQKMTLVRPANIGLFKVQQSESESLDARDEPLFDDARLRAGAVPIQNHVEKIEPPCSPPVDRFPEFWAIYPRRDAKGAAIRAWAKAVKTTPVDEILAGVQRYLTDKRVLSGYVQLPATWLRGQEWLSEGTTTALTLSRSTVSAMSYAERHAGELSDAERKALG